MLDIHAQALEGSSGPYHEFLLMYRAHEPIVYGFVEGRDDPCFYRGFIESALPNGWAVRLIRSGNRKAVIAILSTIPWSRFPMKRICFFIDHDLSAFSDEENVSAQNLYITDNYSIENDVVNDHVFCRVIEEIFGIIDLREDERECICKRFRANLEFFCEAMAPVMAQILIWQREGARATLANIEPKKLFVFRDGCIETSSNYRSPMARTAYAAGCVGLSASDEGALHVAEKEFRERSGLLRFVRGKYLIWFFVECAVSTHQDISNYCTRYSKPPKARVNLGAGNAMTIIGPRAKVPNSLRHFIGTNYLSYIEAAAAPA